MDRNARLDAIHDRLLIGDPTASLDLFREVLGPITAIVVRKHPSLPDDKAHDFATDAVLAHVANPARFDRTKGSLVNFLVVAAHRDAIDYARRRSRETTHWDGVAKSLQGDVEFWTYRAKELFDGEDAMDARRIMTLHGGKLATNPDEAKVLALMLGEEKDTEAYAQALGLDPAAADTGKVVKQVKDRLLLRLRRVRNEL